MVPVDSRQQLLCLCADTLVDRHVDMQITKHIDMQTYMRADMCI